MAHWRSFHQILEVLRAHEEVYYHACVPIRVAEGSDGEVDIGVTKNTTTCIAEASSMFSVDGVQVPTVSLLGTWRRSWGHLSLSRIEENCILYPGGLASTRNVVLLFAGVRHGAWPCSMVLAEVTMFANFESSFDPRSALNALEERVMGWQLFTWAKDSPCV